jgi:hypothetical protein
MILISHRGNIDGPNPEKENHPDYLLDAQLKGYHIEIDIWYLDKTWVLGHDSPQYPIGGDIANKFNPETAWIHIKNPPALEEINTSSKWNYFWHTDEDYVLTSKQFIWVYPNKFLLNKSICVLPEDGFLGNINRCSAICTDFIKKYGGINYGN